MKIADKEIIFNPEFKLYLSTRMNNPEFSTDICSKVNLNLKINKRSLL